MQASLESKILDVWKDSKEVAHIVRLAVQKGHLTRQGLSDIMHRNEAALQLCTGEQLPLHIV